jgi:exosortase C (VPDSG-CTERM-specific)
MLNPPLIEPASRRCEPVLEQAPGPREGDPTAFRQRARGLVMLTFFLAICFGRPLCDLIRLCLRNDLYSHILLIPFISVYLVWLKRHDLAQDSKPARRFVLFPLSVGLALLGGYWFGTYYGWKPSLYDYLALITLSFLSFLLSGCLVFLGKETLRAAAFPLALLIFTVPFPTLVRDGIDSFLQRGSADVAYALFRLSGMPVFRQGPEFQLPGFSLQVAPQCSGIHSSLVLFITSLLAGHLLLGRGWTRAVLVLAVIPLAMLRNGLRIFTLGELCVNVSPNMIHSNIHTHGGPIFFVLSLVPFFFLLLWLRKQGPKPWKSKAAGPWV